MVKPFHHNFLTVPLVFTELLARVSFELEDCFNVQQTPISDRVGLKISPQGTLTDL